jgi:hypothetical protein
MTPVIRKSIFAGAIVALLLAVLFNQSQPSQQLPDATPQKQAAALSATAPKTSSAPLQTGSLREWLAAYRAGGADTQQGIAAATAHHDAIKKLIHQNPRRAFAESLSWSEWAALPAELQALVEKPFSAVVDFESLPNCPPLDPAAPNTLHPHWVKLNGERLPGYVFGGKARLATKEGLPARGFVLDGLAVLADEPLEYLEGDNLRAAEKLFPRRELAGNRTSTVLIGGVLYGLSSAEEEAQVYETLVAAEKGLHPKSVAIAMKSLTAAAGTIAQSVDAAKKDIQIANSTWTETGKRTLALRLSYASAPTSYSFTLTELTNLVVGASNSVKVMSYGKTWLIPSYATVNLPQAQSYYEDNGPDSIVNDARTRLSAMGINTANYDIIIHAHPQSNFGYAGLGQIGAGINWENGRVDLGVLVHEIGHNYGLGHAHYWSGLTGLGPLGRTNPDGSQVEMEEYGDGFDVMGGGPLPAAQYGAHGKVALNWIEQKEVINVVTNGIYRVWRFDHQSARTNLDAKLALKVTAPGGEELWVSHRKLFTSNPSLARGANIVRADGSADQSLIDATPLSKPNGLFGTDRDDAGLAVGKSITDTLGTVRITTIASAGSAPLEYLDVEVAFLESGAFSFYTTNDFKTNGLVGSYVNTSLRGRPQQTDWRSTAGVTIAGRRVDPRLSFTSDGWGARAPVRITGGTDANWDNFSVQWDGFIVVRQPLRMATVSDDSSRFWIDLNGNNAFGATAPEFMNNHWGTGQGATQGDLSPIIPPGTYRIRIQYEEGNGGNYFALKAATLPFQLFTAKNLATPGLTASVVDRSLRTTSAQSDWRSTQTIVGTRVDSYPAFTINGWGSLADVGLTEGPNGTDADWNAFSIQWDGFITNSAPIKLATVSDDGSRLWIDFNTNGTFATTAPEYVNNHWGVGQGATFGSISQTLPPGLYAIRIQYEDGGGDNRFQLAGVPQGPADVASVFTTTTFTGADSLTFSRRQAGDFTIEFWLKTAQVTGGETTWTDGVVLVDASVDGPANDFGVALGNGKILFGVGGATDTTIRSGFVADDQWHFVAARRIQSTGELLLQVDGVVVARGTGGTETLDASANVYIGGLPDGSRGLIGIIDAPRLWEYARAEDQMLADLHTTRAGHWLDAPPEVAITQTSTNAVQVYWDALSSWRVLEGSATIDGVFTKLNTDQNSTNIVIGANPMRYFRVRK